MRSCNHARKKSSAKMTVQDYSDGQLFVGDVANAQSHHLDCVLVMSKSFTVVVVYK